ncbi:MAG TPA: PQQ-dependent sugar dehydrogenase [Burkholderiales bacterium]
MVPRVFATGLVQPVEIVPAGDGSPRLFVVEQAGRVRIAEGRTVLATPFLDLSASVLVGNERGLLGLAFHPEYATNRAFYVYYTAAPNGALTIARYLRDAIDPRRADPASGAVLLSIPHPTFANHNGGRLAFGPDGYLYIGTGDGGGAGDPGNNAQNLGALLGKLLRIEVDAGTQYRIPAGNPFVGNTKCPGGPGPCPEIWAYGLRNPWKFSFDRVNGDMFIGDVGQTAWEEVDYLPFGSPAPANLGWNVFEGTHCFNPPADCSLAGHVPPVIEYPHNATGGNSVTGGYRYHGFRNSPLMGFYVYGDFGSERVWSVRKPAAGPWAPRVLLNPPSPFGGLSSFGEDNAGELYLADYVIGRIWTLEPPLALSSLRIAFPQTAPGTPSAPMTLRLSNSAGVSFAVTGVTAGGDFSVTANGCATLAVGAFCDLSLSFTPAAPGARTGELVIGTNYPGNPQFRVPLSGNRVAGPSRDLDGDGRDDLVLRSAGGSNLLWHVEGAGLLGAAAKIPAIGAAWTVAAVADFDGDGVADLFLRNSLNGLNTVWLMQPGRVKRAAAAPAMADLNWRVAGSGDVDGDGRADIFWRHEVTGANLLWRMNGEAVLETLVLDTVADQQWRIVASGDLDGDGRSDVVWRHGVSGANQVWLLNEAGVKSAGALPAEPDLGWRIAYAADFNGDGRADLVWRHQASGTNRIWLMDGMAVAVEGAISTLGLAWSLSGAGDYNGDGKADLLWTNASTGAGVIWLMNGLAVAAARALPKRPAGMNPVP